MGDASYTPSIVYPEVMATQFAVRAGSSFRCNVEYREPVVPPETDPRSPPLIEVTGYTARLQLRSGSGNRRIILTTWENDVGSTILTHDANHPSFGSWFIYLPANVTRTLPPVSHMEVELVSDADENDVSFLFAGALRTSPEVVV